MSRRVTEARVASVAPQRRSWALYRLLLAAALLLIALSELPALQARAMLRQLPYCDYLGEAEQLRAAGHYGEALATVEAGLAYGPVGLGPALDDARAAIIAERDSWTRRAWDFGGGAITGRDNTPEALAGAVAADFFVIGDVRDLAIQGGRVLRDEEVDYLITGLSAVGVATTVAPYLDGPVSLLKRAAKAKVLRPRFVEQVSRWLRRASEPEARRALGGTFAEMEHLTKRLGPGGTMRALAHVEDAGDLRLIRRFAEQTPHAEHVLRVSGRQGVAALRRVGVQHADDVVVAAQRGPAGVRLLARVGLGCVRPHFLIGLGKAAYRVSSPRVLQRLTAWLDGVWGYVIALLGIWTLWEFGGVWGPSTRRPRRAGEMAREERHGDDGAGRESGVSCRDHAGRRAEQGAAVTGGARLADDAGPAAVQSDDLDAARRMGGGAAATGPRGV